jgi:hypothetical protein
MAWLVITTTDTGEVKRVQYITDVSDWEKIKAVNKGAGVGPTGSPVNQNPFTFDNTTYGVYYTKFLREAILESKQMTAVEKLNSLQEVDKWLPGDSFHYGIWNNKTKTLRANETWQPPRRPIIKFNDP